jgi:hypothetical protein
MAETSANDDELPFCQAPEQRLFRVYFSRSKDEKAHQADQ